MKFDDIDVEKIIKQQGKNSDKKGSGKPSSKGLMDLAGNPLISMAIQNIPNKYKAMIVLAVLFIIVGIGTTIYGIIQLTMINPQIATIVYAILGGFIIIKWTINKIRKEDGVVKKAKK